MRFRTDYSYTEEELKALYRGYDTNRWYDHIYRVNISAEMIRQYVAQTGAKLVADLSCGDRAVTKNLHVDELYLGDIAKENCGTGVVHGKIEDTIKNIPYVDLFILSETIEHVEDPDDLLQQIAIRSNALFLTTPLDETPNTNPEHYWSWGKEDIEIMLRDAGFMRTVFYSELDFGVARYQIWLVTK
jgi:hypothetical protein